VNRWGAIALTVLMAAGCRTPPAPTPAAPTAPATEPSPAPASPAVPAASVQDLAAAVAAGAKRSDGEPDSNVRAQLAEQADADAQACLARAPHAAACLYAHALALGLQARAHPMRAGELLNTMLVSLTDAEAADASYDQAGPARVRALVLIRAPGWPLGPGDAAAGLTAARRAADLQPQYPPNLLALAEALAKSGDATGARAAYQRARAAAQMQPPGAERDGWLREADQALRRL
jgi:hypothetical protein